MALLIAALLVCVLLPGWLLWWLLWRQLRRGPAPLSELSLLETTDSSLLAPLCEQLRAQTSTMVGLAEHILAVGPCREAEQIAEQGRTSLRLLGDAADLARIEAGELDLQPASTDLRALLEHCVALLRPSANQRELTLSLAIAADVPATLTLDRTRLQQVLLNLLGDAVKRTAHGQVAIQVTLAGSHLALSIAAAGIDCDSGREPDAFALTLCKRLIEAMGGELTVNAETGPTLRLPVDTALARQAAPGSASVALSGHRVLVADDHALNRDLMLDMLAALGVTGQGVASGVDALRSVAAAADRGEPFDLVLMDLRMPGIDGLETTQRLRESGHQADRLPIIALTASCLPEDLAACRAAGMQGFLIKPLQLEDLAQTLREVLWARLSPRALDLAALADLPTCPPQSGDLARRYHGRKQALFARLEGVCALPAARADEVDWPGLAMQLHKLAGVAASFDEAGLGDRARELDRQLRAPLTPHQCHALLTRAWPRFALHR